jgi:hypothetical protein
MGMFAEELAVCAPTNECCRYFTATPTEGYPRGGEFIGRVSPRSGIRRCKEHKI